MRDDSAQGVEHKALERMVVQSTICIWDIQAVVPRVEVLVEELVDMEGAVPEVLPGVDAEPGEVAGQ